MNEIEEIRNRIHEIRGRQVMLDKDLAELYGVQTRDLNKAVKRNMDRFPADFMFQLTKEEMENLMFQNGTSRWGGTRKLPFAFTEQGVAMLSGVLRSPTAIEVNIRIMRTFVAVRQYLATPKCNNCQLEGEVKRLASYIEEVLADANDRDEMMERKIDMLENAIGMLQAEVLAEKPEVKSKRVFEMEVKGFKNE